MSVFALAYALLSPILATVTGRWPRRRVLVAGLVLLGSGNAVTALAGGYGLVLASRILAGAGAALFAASAVATAAHLAPERRRGSAVAMVTAGSTLALVLGAPLGTVIGKAWGWQAAIWFITAIAGVVAVAIAGLVCFSVIGPQQHRIIAFAPPGGSALVTSLNLSTAYLGNFGSSVIGAVILTTAGSATFVLPVAAVFATAASLLAWWAGRPAAAPGATVAEEATTATHHSRR